MAYGKERSIDMNGLSLEVDEIKVDGVVVTLEQTAGVTAGTAVANKAVVLGANKEIATITTATITNLTTTTLTPGTVAGAVSFSGVATFNADPVIGVGKTVNLDSNTATLVSHAATLTKFACVVTTEALTTAAGAAQAFVLTLTGVTAGDFAMVQAAGGTNTREHYVYKAITTTDTVTVTVNNIGPTNALNGTLIFNVIVFKA
jgi:hypothetical protein